MTATTKLAEALQAGRPVLTIECLPPGGSAAQPVEKLAETLPETVEAIVVADNPDETRGSALACAAILARAGRQPVLSIATRDRNRIALESDVLGAAALGVRNILCLGGDHQSLGICPPAAGAYDIDSIQLTGALKRMTEDGLGFDGRKLPDAPELFIGAAAHPYLRPMELNIIRLKKKIAAGAKFLLTQAVFDLNGFTEWMDAARQAGLHEVTGIIASVLPLGDAERARALGERGACGPIGDDIVQRLSEAEDPRAEGVAICAELVSKLKGIESLAGIHILCGGCEDTAIQIIDKASLA